ncbi:hypothetical protein O181_062973 [Austropuccinia psidii MF-1]|uniref:Uncharacterized protein n=1 Tax=Austropuccinia psidii MF-1 TaxID=1389203 RepID=A0A9Q3EQR1_9BASI|nr:hypothetical protein [Austropuccinia psidii MF-1]
MFPSLCRKCDLEQAKIVIISPYSKRPALRQQLTQDHSAYHILQQSSGRPSFFGLSMQAPGLSHCIANSREYFQAGSYVLPETGFSLGIPNFPVTQLAEFETPYHAQLSYSSPAFAPTASTSSQIAPPMVLANNVRSLSIPPMSSCFHSPTKTDTLFQQPFQFPCLSLAIDGNAQMPISCASNSFSPSHAAELELQLHTHELQFPFGEQAGSSCGGATIPTLATTLPNIPKDISHEKEAKREPENVPALRGTKSKKPSIEGSHHFPIPIRPTPERHERKQNFACVKGASNSSSYGKEEKKVTGMVCKVVAIYVDDSKKNPIPCSLVRLSEEQQPRKTFEDGENLIKAEESSSTLINRAQGEGVPPHTNKKECNNIIFDSPPISYWDPNIFNFTETSSATNAPLISNPPAWNFEQAGEFKMESLTNDQQFNESFSIESVLPLRQMSLQKSLKHNYDLFLNDFSEEELQKLNPENLFKNEKLVLFPTSEVDFSQNTQVNCQSPSTFRSTIISADETSLFEQKNNSGKSFSSR